MGVRLDDVVPPPPVPPCTFPLSNYRQLYILEQQLHPHSRGARHLCELWRKLRGAMTERIESHVDAELGSNHNNNNIINWFPPCSPVVSSVVSISNYHVNFNIIQSCLSVCWCVGIPGSITRTTFSLIEILLQFNCLNGTLRSVTELPLNRISSENHL